HWIYAHDHLVIADDAARQRARCKLSAGDKPHQRTETPGGRRAQEVQASNRRLKSFVQLRIAIDLADRGEQFGAEERVLRDVDAEAGAEQSVLDGSLASVVQFEDQTVLCGSGGHD